MVAIIASKGGLGASTVTLNLAIAIRKHTKETLCLQISGLAQAV